ncbi:MAG: hypothetical protein EXS64_08415 [Candidatus Latescibacteria bacterium]|nr:hypothetical protein [Candidatus Latescibacterota bacterium]
MVPIRLALHNFLSYGEEVPPLDFTEFRVACISGPNGHGKSALLDAMTWALWGEARRGASDRKPDEGLLRIGASEMRVEFEFDLEGARYRVLRSFRKTARGGIASLELQAFDHDRGTYVTMSEANSITKTQARIEALLRMSYDTFATSALVLQGRADEFTTRLPRERKTVLAEILGLSRYDELARLARTRAQDAGRSADRSQARLADIDAELEGRPQIERERDEIAENLAQAQARIGASEKTLNDLLARRSEIAARGREAGEAKAALARAEAEVRETGQEAEQVRRQVREDEALLSHRKEIEAAAEAHARLRAQEAALQSKLHTLRELEADRARLETKIAEARHEVERRKEGWEARLKAAQEAAEEARRLTIRQGEIEKGYGELQQARRDDQAWEERRARFEALDAQGQDLERRIAEVRARLNADLEVLRAQRRALDERASAGERARGEQAAAAEELDRLTVLEREREGLRDQGSALTAQIDANQRQAETLEKDLHETSARLELLRKSEDAHCPLCESSLDARRRGALVARLSEETRQKNREITGLRRKAREEEERRSDFRARYQRIKEQTKGLADLQGRLISLENLVREASEVVRGASQFEERIAALEAQIEAGAFAGDERAQLADLRRAVEAVGYRRERHTAIREAITRLSPFEAEKARLDAASENLKRALEGVPEVREKIDTADLYLREKRYAQREHTELRALTARIDALGYDPDRHQRISEEVERTADAIAQRDRIEMAGARLTRAKEDLARAERRAEARQKEAETLKARLQALEQDAQQAAQIERALSGAETDLRALRDERDRLLQRQGSLAGRLDRCALLAAERDGVEAACKAARKDQEVYETLTTAFGRDGIQALIIENAIPEIESEANRILARLTDNRTQVAIESLRDLKKGGTRETLDIKISDELGERSYELYSGGEAFRINFALRIALARLLAQRAGTRLRTLILDEGFGTQDAEGLEHLIEAIQAISEDFDKVLVITHVDELKNAFPVRIQVTKHPDIGSRFEIIY